MTKSIKLFGALLLAMVALHIISVNIRLYNIQKHVMEISDAEVREILIRISEECANTMMVTLTYYQPVTEQCDSTPLITADNSRIDLDKLARGEIKWCAVSQDLRDRLPFGSSISIPGLGVYKVRDVMNPRHRNRVDILVHPDKKLRLPKDKVAVTKIN